MIGDDIEIRHTDAALPFIVVCPCGWRRGSATLEQAEDYRRQHGADHILVRLRSGLKEARR